MRIITRIGIVWTVWLLGLGVGFIGGCVYAGYTYGVHCYG